VDPGRVKTAGESSVNRTSKRRLAARGAGQPRFYVASKTPSALLAAQGIAGCRTAAIGTLIAW
jgi:hypothetical protein